MSSGLKRREQYCPDTNKFPTLSFLYQGTSSSADTYSLGDDPEHVHSQVEYSVEEKEIGIQKSFQRRMVADSCALRDAVDLVDSPLYMECVFDTTQLDIFLKKKTKGRGRWPWGDDRENDILYVTHNLVKRMPKGSDVTPVLIHLGTYGYNHLHLFLERGLTVSWEWLFTSRDSRTSPESWLRRNSFLDDCPLDLILDLFGIFGVWGSAFNRDFRKQGREVLEMYAVMLEEELEKPCSPEQLSFSWGYSRNVIEPEKWAERVDRAQKRVRNIVQVLKRQIAKIEEES